MEFNELVKKAEEVSAKLKRSVKVEVVGWKYTHSDNPEIRYNIYIADLGSFEFSNPLALMRHMEEDVLNPPTEGLTLEDD